MTKLNYGEYTQKAIDEGCKLKITSEDYYSATHTSFAKNYSVYILNEAGKELAQSFSKVTLEKALNSLEETDWNANCYFELIDWRKLNA